MIALAIAFPLLTHAAVVSHASSLTIASLAVLTLLVLLPRLVGGNLVAWCTLPVVVGALILLWRAHAAWLPLYATPAIITFFIAWMFGHTLAAGEVPLVERLARLLHEKETLPDDIRAYARKVTIAWTLLTSALGLLNLTLAFVAEPNGVLRMMGIVPPFSVHIEIWSLFANFLNYVIVGVFFLLEFFYRRYRFPEQRYRNVFEFLRRAAAVGPRVMRTRHD